MSVSISLYHLNFKNSKNDNLHMLPDLEELLIVKSSTYTHQWVVRLIWIARSVLTILRLPNFVSHFVCCLQYENKRYLRL